MTACFLQYNNNQIDIKYSWTLQGHMNKLKSIYVERFYDNRVIREHYEKI